MRPKQILTLSVLAGLAAVVLVQVQLRSERGETVTLFRATETRVAGETLGGRLEPVTLPGDKLFPNLLKEAPTADMRDFVSSSPLRETVHAGEVVLYRHLEASADSGLRARIPHGKRAFSIEVSSATAVAFLVEPEDRVDVLAAVPDPALGDASAGGDGLAGVGGLGGAFNPAKLEQAMAAGELGPGLLAQMVGSSPGSASREAMRTEVLLENVEVLAVGRRYRRAQPQERGASYDTVTLLVSEDEATTLAHARDVQGSPMTLVLRGLDDAVEGGSPS